MPRADIDAEEIRRQCNRSVTRIAKCAAVGRCSERKRHRGVIPVADERSAAFIALGYAAVSDAPVAIICTSGTAVLNYGPAVAEAFYRALPLIVISADRPYEWIDQDDSQTIRQPGTFANFTKGSYDLNESVTDADKWYANRMINDAMTLAFVAERVPSTSMSDLTVLWEDNLTADTHSQEK